MLGQPHYLRGRCQYALRQLVEARESFDRACSLEPELVEHSCCGARSIDRSDAYARPSAVSRRCSRAFPIEKLRRPGYETDAAAQLVLAGCLHHERRFDEAAAIYERIENVDPSINTGVETGAPILADPALD